MKKKLVSVIVAVAVAVTGVVVTDTNTRYAKAEEQQISPDTVIASIPQFKSEYDFNRYVENDDGEKSNYIVQEQFTTNWEGYGGVHTLTVPEDGKLVFYTFTSVGNENNVKGTLFRDFALTQKVVEGSNETLRKNLISYDVKKGTTYYFRQERWNGTGECTATTYMGLIPTVPSAACVSTSAIFVETDNVPVKEFGTIEEFKTAVNTMTPCSTSYVKETGRGKSESYKFTVKSAGWLLSYAINQSKYIRQVIFADKNFCAYIDDSEHKSFDEEPKLIWLEPGTYYYYNYRWNGYTKECLEEPISVYLGFIPVSKYFSIDEPVLNADKSSAVVKFKTTTAGNIRVMNGYPFPKYINDDTFWQVKTRLNMVADNTYTATSNGDYVARFEDTASKMCFMLPFSISGLTNASKDATGTSVTDKNTGNNNAAIDGVTVPGRVVFKAKNIKGKKIQVKINPVSGTAGYKIKYAKNKKFKKAKIKIVTKTSYKIKKLKKKKKYYIRVCAFNSAGDGKWSKTAKVKVKK